MEEIGDAEYFLARADQCMRLAEVNRQAALELEAMGNGFMAKAVEYDTQRQKHSPERKSTPSKS